MQIIQKIIKSLTAQKINRFMDYFQNIRFALKYDTAILTLVHVHNLQGFVVATLNTIHKKNPRVSHISPVNKQLINYL